MKEKEELMYESEEEDKPMMASLAAPSEGYGILRDVFSWKDWANPLLWKAGVSQTPQGGEKKKLIFFDYPGRRGCGILLL